MQEIKENWPNPATTAPSHSTVWIFEDEETVGRKLKESRGKRTCDKEKKGSISRDFGICEREPPKLKLRVCTSTKSELSPGSW